MNRESVLAGLHRVSELLADRGLAGEIDIVRGAAMMLAFQARQSTKDVDAVFCACFGDQGSGSPRGRRTGTRARLA